jgi:hypothetical protein
MCKNLRKSITLFVLSELAISDTDLARHSPILALDDHAIDPVFHPIRFVDSTNAAKLQRETTISQPKRLRHQPNESLSVR